MVCNPKVRCMLARFQPESRLFPLYAVRDSGNLIVTRDLPACPDFHYYKYELHVYTRERSGTHHDYEFQSRGDLANARWALMSVWSVENSLATYECEKQSREQSKASTKVSRV